MTRSIIVLVLLSIPALEWLMPGMCAEDLQGLSLSLALSARTDSSHKAVVGAPMPEPEHSNQPGHPIDDECFCCCQHVVPPLTFVPAHLETSVEITVEPPTDRPSPPRDPPDHPPRLS